MVSVTIVMSEQRARRESADELVREAEAAKAEALAVKERLLSARLQRASEVYRERLRGTHREQPT